MADRSQGELWKLIVKRPGTLGYKMHQDHPYWELLGAPADAYVTVLLAA